MLLMKISESTSRVHMSYLGPEASVRTEVGFCYQLTKMGSRRKQNITMIDPNQEHRDLLLQHENPKQKNPCVVVLLSLSCFKIIPKTCKSDTTGVATFFTGYLLSRFSPLLLKCSN